MAVLLVLLLQLLGSELDLPILPPDDPRRDEYTPATRPEPPTGDPIDEPSPRPVFFGEELVIDSDDLVVFVLDKSSSMQYNEQWERAKQNTLLACSNLDEGKWGVVLFDSHCPGWYTFPPNRGDVEALAAWLQTFGPLASTDTASGVVQGLGMRPTVVVLLTDGVPNVHLGQLEQPQTHRRIIRGANSQVGARIDVFMLGDLGTVAEGFCHGVAQDSGGTVVRVP